MSARSGQKNTLGLVRAATAEPQAVAPRIAATWGRRLVWAVLVTLIFFAAPVIMLMSSALDEDFWWTDSASFALNGELVRDYLASALGSNPLQFAADWYLHYPALSISLYPPIFPLAEALMFSVFGFSHAAAQATVTIFAAAATSGLYLVTRKAVGMPLAIGATLLLFITPEMLRWSRQIVMEVPALAFLLLAAAALLHYQATRIDKWLLASVGATLLAAYTKQAALFVAPAFAAALLIEQKYSLLRNKSAWIALGLGLLGLVPLGVFTFLYAMENINIAFGPTTGTLGYDRLSVQGLLAYGRSLPDIVGVIPLIGSCGYLSLLLMKGWGSISERRLTVLMSAWFVIDYLLVSITADFETRYATFLTVPPVVLTILLLARLVRPVYAQIAALAICAAVFLTTVMASPVPRCGGYAEAARFVQSESNPDEIVMFHGKESKSFIFSLRVRAAQAKLSVLRSDKLLVRYSIVREWGITDRGLSVQEIDALIDEFGIRLLVLQPDFWTDQPSMAALQSLAYSDRFSQVAEFPIACAGSSLRVYRNNRPVTATQRTLRINVPALRTSISGRL